MSTSHKWLTLYVMLYVASIHSHDQMEKNFYATLTHVITDTSAIKVNTTYQLL